MPVFSGQVKFHSRKADTSFRIFSKSVRKMSYFGSSCIHSLGRQYLDDIKAGLKLCRILLKIKLGGGAQTLLLARIHKLRRGAEGGAAAQLHLYKTQIVSVLGNQIQFSKPAPPTRSHDLISPLPQKVGCQGLPPPAQQAALLPAHRFFKKERRWMGLGP